MLSSREGTGVRSARKYAVHGASPLAKDSTLVTPVRPSTRRKDSFSTSHHMHGVGGEAKEAMLRSGLRVKRTHSLRMVATKGNATLTAMFHNFPTPDLDLFRKLYQRMESEFAEQIPSAVCPFQFVPNDSTEISRWRAKSDNPEETPEPESEGDSKMNDWLKDMRLKVHSRLVQKQQFANTVNLIETQPQPLQLGSKKDKEDSTKKPGSPKEDRLASPDSKRKGDKPRMELALDTIEPPSHSPRSHSARSFYKPRLSPKNSSRVGPAPLPSSPSNSPPGSPNKKAKHDKRLPPLQHRISPLPSSASASTVSPLSPSSSVKPLLPKIASHDSPASMMDAGGPLFYPRNDPIYGRRTYSELDVRRVRAKARNLGMD